SNLPSLNEPGRFSGRTFTGRNLRKKSGSSVASSTGVSAILNPDKFLFTKRKHGERFPWPCGTTRIRIFSIAAFTGTRKPSTWHLERQDSLTQCLLDPFIVCPAQ